MTANNEWPCWNVNHIAAGNHDVDGLSCGPICPNCSDPNDFDCPEVFAVLWQYRLRNHSDEYPSIQYRLRCPSCGEELRRSTGKGKPPIWNVSHKEVEQARQAYDAAYDEYVMNAFEIHSRVVNKSTFLEPALDHRIQVAKGGPECAHKLCERTDTELHHFMPRSFADSLPDQDDPENWPKAWLCVFHHRMVWHAVVTPQFAIHG